MVWRGRVAGLALVAVAVVSCSSALTTVEQSQRPLAVEVSTTQPVAAPTPAATTAPTPIAIPPTPTPLPIEERTLLFSGDVLSHTPVMAQALAYGNVAPDSTDRLAYDYRPMFADVAARVGRADLAICVLETPVSIDNVGLDGYPTFEAPRELPDALVHAGYDGCATASNHSLDRGPDGAKVTLDMMDRVSLGHAGMARTSTEADQPRLYDLGGVAVAHLSFTYGLNGFRLPADEPWLVDVNDVDAIRGKTQRARDAGADLVVLSIQWGNEYQRRPSDQQLALARELTNGDGPDLIIGNHAHVVQPVDEVNGIPVVYGLGNSLSNQFDNANRTGTQDGVMIEVAVAGNADVGYSVSGLSFAPTWVDRSNYTIVDLLDALADPDLDEGTRAVYQASFDRTVEAVHLLGMEIPLAD